MRLGAIAKWVTRRMTSRGRPLRAGISAKTALAKGWRAPSAHLGADRVEGGFAAARHGFRTRESGVRPRSIASASEAATSSWVQSRGCWTGDPRGSAGERLIHRIGEGSASTSAPRFRSSTARSATKVSSRAREGAATVRPGRWPRPARADHASRTSRATCGRCASCAPDRARPRNRGGRGAPRRSPSGSRSRESRAGASNPSSGRTTTDRRFRSSRAARTPRRAGRARPGRPRGRPARPGARRRTRMRGRRRPAGEASRWRRSRPATRRPTRSRRSRRPATRGPCWAGSGPSSRAWRSCRAIARRRRSSASPEGASRDKRVSQPVASPQPSWARASKRAVGTPSKKAWPRERSATMSSTRCSGTRTTPRSKMGPTMLA